MACRLERAEIILEREKRGIETMLKLVVKSCMRDFEANIDDEATSRYEFSCESFSLMKEDSMRRTKMRIKRRRKRPYYQPRDASIISDETRDNHIKC